MIWQTKSMSNHWVSAALNQLKFAFIHCGEACLQLKNSVFASQNNRQLRIECTSMHVSLWLLTMPAVEKPQNAS